MEPSTRSITDALLASRARVGVEEAFQLDCMAELIDRYQTVPALDIPGAEQLVAAGADGTPLVAEFLAAELAPLLGESIPTAWNLIHDVANLRARHPRLWAAVHDGRVQVWQARQIAAQTAAAGLGLDAARWVDARLEPALGRLAWARLRRKTSGLILAADTQLAAERAQARSRERYVRITHDTDGASWLTARLDTTDAIRLADAIDAIAADLATHAVTGSMDELRAHALGVLATATEQGELPQPKATLVVHVARETLDEADGVARVDGVGPLLLTQVQDLLEHRQVRLLPVLDLAGDPCVDGYEIPDRIRTQLQIVHPYSVFPYSTKPSTACDADHTIPYDPDGPPGQTRPSNLGPLGRAEHRPKTFTGWQVTQTEPGSYRYTSPLGYRYTVDAHGTTFAAKPAFRRSEYLLFSHIALAGQPLPLLNGQPVRDIAVTADRFALNLDDYDPAA